MTKTQNCISVGQPLHRVESKSDYKNSVEQLKQINFILEDLKLEVDAIELFTFIESAIILREESKFEFTKIFLRFCR